MHELGDFPREILEISLGYMPSDTLITLLDIPQVETLARRLLYTTIRIGASFMIEDFSKMTKMTTMMKRTMKTESKANI